MHIDILYISNRNSIVMHSIYYISNVFNARQCDAVTIPFAIIMLDINWIKKANKSHSVAVRAQLSSSIRAPSRSLLLIRPNYQIGLPLSHLLTVSNEARNNYHRSSYLLAFIFYYCTNGSKAVAINASGNRHHRIFLLWYLFC